MVFTDFSKIMGLSVYSQKTFSDIHSLTFGERLCKSFLFRYLSKCLKISFIICQKLSLQNEFLLIKSVFSLIFVIFHKRTKLIDMAGKRLMTISKKHANTPCPFWLHVIWLQMHSRLLKIICHRTKKNILNRSQKSSPPKLQLSNS